MRPEPRGLALFRIDVPASALEDLAGRLALAVGGHFLAYERPAEFVEDVRAFFRDYRGARGGSVG